MDHFPNTDRIRIDNNTKCTNKFYKFQLNKILIEKTKLQNAL